ncbi:MAG: glycosyltransferase [Ramlibacter sp.]|nr:glycosyltransferase [Ramlibacter sp.]
MVIVDDGEDNRLAEWIASTGDPDIRIIRLPDDGRTLGALRNIAVQKSRGTLVCQWDDDDLYHPLRLEIQCRALLATQSDACFLSMWMMWWPHAGRFAVSGIHSWEGSVLAKKSKLPAYPELRRGEDTPAIRKLIANSKVIHLDQPSLYLYCVHGKKHRDNRHFESMWNEAVRHYEGRDAAAIKLKLQQMYPVLNDDFVYPAPQHRAKVSAWERLKRRFARAAHDIPGPGPDADEGHQPAPGPVLRAVGSTGLSERLPLAWFSGGQQPRRHLWATPAASGWPASRIHGASRSSAGFPLG